MIFSSALVSALVFLVASATAHSPDQQQAKRHSELANVIERSATNQTSVAKRGQTFSGHATFFYVGIGACGKWSKDSDYMVALNTPQYGRGYPGPHCFKTIRIHAGGKSAVATILDECPTCPDGCLDMSPALFQHFNPLGVGEFPITWEYTDGSDDPPPPPPPPPKKTTTTKHTSSTSHTTSTKKATSTKHSSSTSKTSNTSAKPTPASPPPAENIALLNEAFIAIAQIIEAGASQK